MSEEELELLITLDDPGDAPEEDTFNHQAENTLEYWLSRWSSLSLAIWLRFENADQSP